ncbi:uncharacterized protein [Porites lutea]|uniref:uncharacterized protein isoform X3 n=1 Tax=Porites lutea TaxID=51062 RepID=UPI003CC5421F
MALRIIIGALKRAYPRVPVMTTDELQHLMKKTASQSGYRKLVLLDTRGENEFRVSRLANAIHLDPEETDLTKVMKMIQKEAGTTQGPMAVVCYCAIGWRASIMSQRLLDELEKPENQDIKSSLEVYNLEGAIFKWANERKDLVDPDGNDTDSVHTFTRLKGMLVDKELRRLDP